MGRATLILPRKKLINVWFYYDFKQRNEQSQGDLARKCTKKIFVKSGQSGVQDWNYLK
jgi:hypothetical protein